MERQALDQRVALVGRQAGQIEQRQRERQRGCDELAQLPIVDAKGGAQRLVALHDGVEATRQEGDIEATAQANDGSKMIGRAGRLQLVQKPEPLLGE